MNTLRWVNIEDSFFLMVRVSDHEIPEWHLIAEVHWRKVYSTLPAQWYVLVPDSPGERLTLLNRYDDLSFARGVAERYVFELFRSDISIEN